MSGMDGDMVCAESRLPATAPLMGPTPESAPLRWRRSFPGEAQQVGLMRQWLSSLLPECPARADVLSVGSELAANAIQHTLTGQGGRFDVELTVQDSQIVLAVADGGGHSAPALVDAPEGERGRGLQVVGALSAAYWYSGDENGREIWAEIPWEGMPIAVPDYLADGDAEYVLDRSVADHRRPDPLHWEIGAP